MISIVIILEEMFSYVLLIVEIFCHGRPFFYQISFVLTLI